MAIPTRFAQLNVSSDGSNWGYLKSAATTNNLELKPADGSSVVVDAPLYYLNSSSVSTALNATFDSMAASIATFATKLYIDTADGVLQDNISAEAASRESADITLQSNLDAESSARASADTTLQNNVDAEASARTAADDALTVSVSDEATARAAADTALDTRVAAIEALLSQLGSASP